MSSVTWNAKSVRPLPPIALPALKMGLMNLFWMGVRVLTLQPVHPPPMPNPPPTFAKPAMPVATIAKETRTTAHHVLEPFLC